jgi:hypothetical protein
MRVKQSKGGRFEHLLLLSAITNPINVSNYALIHYLWYQEVVWRSACVGIRFFVQVLGLLVSVSVLCLRWCWVWQYLSMLNTTCLVFGHQQTTTNNSSIDFIWRHCESQLFSNGSNNDAPSVSKDLGGAESLWFIVALGRGGVLAVSVWNRVEAAALGLSTINKALHIGHSHSFLHPSSSVLRRLCVSIVYDTIESYYLFNHVGSNCNFST